MHHTHTQQQTSFSCCCFGELTKRSLLTNSHCSRFRLAYFRYQIINTAFSKHYNNISLHDEVFRSICNRPFRGEYDFRLVVGRTSTAMPPPMIVSIGCIFLLLFGWCALADFHKQNAGRSIFINCQSRVCRNPLSKSILNCHSNMLNSSFLAHFGTQIYFADLGWSRHCFRHQR